jgi:hypothetical protein
LAKRLHAIGVEDSERNIRSKISREGSTATYFFQAADGLAREFLRLAQASGHEIIQIG